VNALWDELVVIAGKEENMLLDVETMLNLDLYDERPCRFVPEFHCRGKRYSILMLSMNSVAVVSISFQNWRVRVHGLPYHLDRVPPITHSRKSN
jgi:hypothetical protein